jgi:hypothetical protein
MNVLDILKYGQQTILRTLESFPETQVETPGACGYWSVKDIIAHLASHEQVLVDVLASFASGSATPTLDKHNREGGAFNDKEVDLRKMKTLKEVTAELAEAHSKSMALATKISPETFRKPGTLPWYGSEYSLDDFIVYGTYGHKREHSAQIAAFHDTVKEKASHSQNYQTSATLK